MKKIKVGLPRALTYYRNNVFWQYFLRKLNCKVIVGPPPDEQIIALGNKYVIPHTCDPYKAYIGEITYLDPICDYILITSIDNYGKLEACPKLTSAYDEIKNIISKQKILNNHINYKKYKFEISEAIKIGLRLNKNPLRIIYSYIIANKKQKKYNLTKQLENKNKLTKTGKKVLIISEYYNLENQSIISNITEELNKYGIIYLLSNYLDSSLAIEFSDYFTEDFKLKPQSEAIGSLYYYQYQINGVILLSQSMCPIDNIINNTLIIKKNKIPIINININEKTAKNKILALINTIKRQRDE